jgi:hypothetical protein
VSFPALFMLALLGNSAHATAPAMRLVGSAERWQVSLGDDELDVLELSEVLGDLHTRDRARARLRLARIPMYSMMATGVAAQALGLMGFGIAGLVHAMDFEVDSGAVLVCTQLVLGGGALIGGGAMVYHFGTKPRALDPQRYYRYDELFEAVGAQAESARSSVAWELSLHPGALAVGVRF